MKLFKVLAVTLLFTLLLSVLPSYSDEASVSSTLLDGKPDISTGSSVKYYVWHTGKIVNIRWTADGTSHIFHGNITSDAPLTSVVRINLEVKDYIAVTNKRAITFKTTTTSGLDGFSFKTNNCTWVKIALKLDGKFIGTTKIYLGKDKVNPSGNPIIVNSAQ